MESKDQLLLAIKEEIDTMSTTNENLYPAEHNTTNMTSSAELQNATENPFKNVQLHVKQEGMEMEVSNSGKVEMGILSSENSGVETLNSETQMTITESENSFNTQRNDTYRHDIEINMKDDNYQQDYREVEESENSFKSQKNDTDQHDTEMNMKDDNYQQDYRDINVKEEHNENSSVSENHNFDDSISMDSDDATALGNVEACLQEEINIKFENEGCEESNKEDLSETNIKLEPVMTLTETNITPINEIKSEHQSVPTGLIVVKKVGKITMPEESIPSCSNGNLYADDSGMYDADMSYSDCDDTKPNVNLYNTETCTENAEEFQLNSITGNVLSLEQEALLLKGYKDRPFKCPECPKSFRANCYLKTHLNVHRTIERRARGVAMSVETKRRNLKNKIPFNQRFFKLVENDQSLPTQRKEDYNCTCGKTFKRRSRMETCLRSHDLSESDSKCVSCLTCTKQFKSKDELALHRKRLHRKKFPCKFCPTAYDTRKELFKHLQHHQKVQLMEYKVISEVVKGKKKLCCFMCSKTYVELSELKTHVMTDHKGPYACPHCKNSFPKIIDFANHMKTYHPEVECQSVFDVLEAFSKLVKAWKCEECGVQFLEPDKLALHEVEAHSPDCKSEPQFQCMDCRRVFISQKGLTSHRRIHHSEAMEETKEIPQGIMCLECRKICKDISALTSHMRLHSPDRKYPCKFCDFRFATPEKRKAHAEVHTGDMKYVCFICEYQCSSENRLKKHKMSLKHANIKEYLLTGKPLIEEPTDTKKDVKKKDLKKKKVDDLSENEDSESDSDSSEEVACDICGEKFKTNDEMQSHKETHPFIEIPSSGDNPTRIFFK